MALAPEHPMSKSLAAGLEQEADVAKFVDETIAEEKIERTAEGSEKRGVFTGRYATKSYKRRKNTDMDRQLRSC